MQRKYEEKQQLQVHLKEAAETCCVKCAAQKARKAAETKTREEAEKQKFIEEEEKRNR